MSRLTVHSKSTSLGVGPVRPPPPPPPTKVMGGFLAVTVRSGDGVLSPMALVATTLSE